MHLATRCTTNDEVVDLGKDLNISPIVHDDNVVVVVTVVFMNRCLLVMILLLLLLSLRLLRLL